MAVDHVLLRWAGIASEDLSAKQYHFIEVEAEGGIEVAEENSRAYVLQDAPKENQPGTYAVAGIAKAIAGEEILGGEAISVNGESTAKKATATKVGSEKVETEGTLIVGHALTKAAAKGDLFTFVVSTGGRA